MKPKKKPTKKDTWLSDHVWIPLLDNDYSAFFNHNCSRYDRYLDIVKGSFGSGKELRFLNNDEINYHCVNCLTALKDDLFAPK